MTEYAGFRTEVHGDGVLVVTLDRPARMNAMTQAMKRDLIELMSAVQMDDGVRVVVFTGANGAFCAGDDLAGYSDDAPTTVPRIGPGHHTEIGTANALRVYSQALTLAVRNLDKITIAAIAGPAIQSGLTLALACDFRMASTRAKLGSATLRFGLLPDEGGHVLLVQHLGVAKALDFLLRKRIVSGSDALGLGLVSEVHEPDDLLPQALALADELAAGPQVAMRLLKRATYVAAEAGLQHALDDIALRTAAADHHPDAKEGAASFREKRAPKFNAWLEGR